MKNKIITTVVVMILALQTSSLAEDTPGMDVHNTENHGIYVTVGGTKVECDQDELPFIDENNRTQVPVRAIAEVLGKKVDWSEDTATVSITPGKNTEGDSVFFEIGSKKIRKNSDIITMDTEAIIVNDHIYIPLRFMGEAFGYDVNYTTDDRFQDITITLKQGILGFKQTDTITLWGNLQDEFHEGLSNRTLITEETPELQNNNINEYEITLNDDNEMKTMNLYWDTLYNNVYIEDEGILYTGKLDVARYIDSFLENGAIKYNIPKDVQELFGKYNWTIDYKINELEEVMPELKDLGSFAPDVYYYTYNSILSGDIRLYLEGYTGKTVQVDIYRLREGMPDRFFSNENARGIVIKYDDEIIGAYISAGRHSLHTSCSLKRKTISFFVSGGYLAFIHQQIMEDENIAEDNIVKDNPEEIIQRYFNALANKDEQTATNCISKLSLMNGLTTNIRNNELYNTKIMLPLTNVSFLEDGKNFVDNVKSIDNIQIEHLQIKEVNNRLSTYNVTFDIEYEKEETLSSGSQNWNCYCVYESDKTGWKISEFRH